VGDLSAAPHRRTQCDELRKAMKITIIGTGYVGLVTGACLAELGNDVFCLDVDQRKIDLLNNGGIPIHEPGLEEVVARNRAAGRLHFSTDVAASVAHGQLQFIAVGTPPDEDGSADLQYVLAAARSIGRHMDGFKVIVDKSTVPVGTADRVAAAIRRAVGARRADRLHRRLEPGIPERGRRRRGLHAPGPHRHRPRRHPERPARARAHEAAVRAVQPQPRAHLLDGRALGRVHQVRRQRHAGDPHLVHERTGQPGRQGGRRHRSGAPRHRLRPAHRPQLPVRRRRLRRLLLPEGRAGDRTHRAPVRPGPADPERRGSRQRAPEAGAGPQGRGALRRRPVRQALRRLGPGLQAEHRRHARSAVARAAAGTDRARRHRHRARPGGDGRSAPRAGHGPRRDKLSRIEFAERRWTRWMAPRRC
jgi:hypothetical protein